MPKSTLKLCLDTTHFREQYRSRAAKPGTSPTEILSAALTCGIARFDAAGAYDEAEKILGRFIRSHRKKHFDITTKIRPNALYHLDPEDYYAKLEQSLAGSLRNFGLDHVYACLFHNGDYLEDRVALASLYALKKEGLTEKVGVCVTSPEQFHLASQSPYIDVIQIPYNVLDTRLDLFLQRTDKEIQARNVFLKGLILRDEHDIPKGLSEVKPYLHTLSTFCERYGVTRCELAMSFIRTQPAISELILNVETVSQLEEDCSCFNRSGNTTALRELTEQLGGLDERIINPSLWRGEYK